MNGDDRNAARKKGNHIQKARGYPLCNQYRDMVICRIAASLYIPVFNCPDDVARIRWTEHDLNFITRGAVGICVC